MTVHLSNQDLISRCIERHPVRPELAEARLANSLVPVWAVIGQLHATGESEIEVAADHGVPPETIRTAVAYCELHREILDDRLRANRISQS